MKTELTIITEASEQIGTGHLVESINIFKTARDTDMAVRLFISHVSPKNIPEERGVDFTLFENLTEVLSHIGTSCKTIITNFRKIGNSEIHLLKGAAKMVLSIDELGGRSIDADYIVNPLISKKYHNYPNSKYKHVFKGPDYLPIAPTFTEYRLSPNRLKAEIKLITVCMGGIDRGGTTVRILKFLSELNNDLEKRIIIGGGFPHTEELNQKLSKLRDKNFTLCKNVNDIHKHFSESDLVINAGGNVIYELACLGVPSITLYEDVHEKDSAEEFQKHGFGISLGNGEEIKREMLIEAIGNFSSLTERQRQLKAGQKIVDGKGIERILKILRED